MLTIIASCMLLFGCNNMNEKEAIKKYDKLLDSHESYTLSGKLDIVSNEDMYHYDVLVKYLKGDYYLASLKNTDNNNEQVILKNEDGVYVITPSINKSFKFQSEWPFNSSQSYILASILKDLENDSNVRLEKDDENYYLYSTVNYPTNVSLVSQKVTFDKDMIPKCVSVFNKDGVENITFKISKIDFDSELTKEDFEVDRNVNYEENTEVSKLDEIVYPMYLPSGTAFKKEENLTTDETQRVILTFTGAKSFTLIEEVPKVSDKHEISTVSGELVFYENLIGNLTSSSLNWTSNGKNYYILSNDLTDEELLKIASSTSSVALIK